MDQREKCANLDICTFFRAYGTDERYHAAVSDFIRLYCQGGGQDKCVRKGVGKKLGGPENVPSNMLPNGLPLTGTDDSGWFDEAVEAVGHRRVRRQT